MFLKSSKVGRRLQLSKLGRNAIAGYLREHHHSDFADVAQFRIAECAFCHAAGDCDVPATTRGLSEETQIDNAVFPTPWQVL